MGVDVKDHRRHLKAVDEAKEAEEAVKPQPLMQQVNIAQETGDARLDKMLRAIAAEIENSDKHAVAVAFQIAGCINVDQVKLKQLEYAYTRGMQDAFKVAAQMPEKIILEERGSAQTTH